MDRHHRQMRLPLVGKSGQRAIAEATIDVPAAGVEGEIMARYLAGAGVAKLRTVDEASAAAARAIDAAVSASPSPSHAPLEPEPMTELDDLDPAARDVARGARGAVRALVRVLGHARGGTE